MSGSTWTGGVAGQAVVLTYSFSTSATAALQASNPGAAASFSPLTDAEKSTVRAALAQWSAISGISFYETVQNPGDLTFGLYDLGTLGGDGDAGLGNYPNPGFTVDANGKPTIYSNFQTEGGDVYFDRTYAGNPNYAADFAHVAVHEIGHALGLKHPFDTPGNTLDSSMDNGSQTVMAYAGIRSATLEPLDVAAIQALYGTKSGATHPVAITWNPGTESLTLVGTSAAQAMLGSGGDDVFYANGGADAISGGEGDDIIYAAGAAVQVNGGPGIDTVVTGVAYTGGMVGGSGTFRYIGVPGGTQIYSNVERLDFTNGVYDLVTNTFSAVQPGTYRWTGNTDGAWATPGNWKAITGGSAAKAPGAADAVTLGVAGPVTGGGQSASLSLSGSPILSGQFTTGTLAGGTASTMIGAGTSLAATASATLSGGLITVTGAGAVLEVGGRGFTTGGSGTVELDAGGVITGYGTINANVFDNLGTINAAGGTLRLIGAQSVSAPGASHIAAGSTLWVQNLNGSYSFDGPGGTLRTDTPSLPVPQRTVISGFVAGDKLVLSGALPLVAYTATGNGLGTLAAAGTVLTLQGDYSQSLFSASANLAENTTTITLGPRPTPAPDPLFDAAYYLARNPDVKAAGVDANWHYQTYGWKEGRDPSALFSTRTYLAANPDVKAAGVEPLAHYEQSGAREGRNPDAWFDSRYYLTQNPDVKAAGVNPLLHFIKYGWTEGREPSLVFSDAKYLAANPDVKAAGLNPLVHYVGWGQNEGRQVALSGGTAPTDPLVDTAYYDAQLGATLIPGGQAGAQQAAASYDSMGWQLGLNPDAWFNTSYYLSHNPDVAAAHINPLLHYETYGWLEGRDPSAGFSTNKYLGAYADVKAAAMDPLLHFAAYGSGEGRSTFAV